MSDSARTPPDKSLAIDVSRRSACAILGLGTMLLGRRAFATDKSIEWELAEQYGLMRRAYQTGNAELLRQFYSDDVVLATEGASPVVGLDSAIAAGHAVLAKRRDVTVDILRIIHSVAGDAVAHFARLCAYPRDAAESPRVATALLLWQQGSAGWRCSAEQILMQDMGAVAGFRTTKERSFNPA
jgi:ketosteroid isomerase-like protein